MGPGLCRWQVLSPELLQVQFIPQPATQPAITEEARPFKRQFGKLNFQSVENLGRNVPVLGEEADLLSELINFIEDLQALAPGRLLRVIDLTQVENGSLGRTTHAQTPVFDDAKIAMLFAVFFASVKAQKHVVGQQSTTVAQRCGRG